MMEMVARFMGMVVLAECVHGLVGLSHWALMAVFARALAHFDRHVVVFASSDRDLAMWRVRAVLRAGSRDARAGDTALGLRLLALLVRKAQVPRRMCPAVHLHVVVPEGDRLFLCADADAEAEAEAEAEADAGGAAGRGDVHVHVYRHGSGEPALCRGDGGVLPAFPCRRVHMLVACSGATLTDDLLNFVVGARPVDVVVLAAAAHEGATEPHSTCTDEVPLVMPRGWREYLLQAARRAYLFSSPEARLEKETACPLRVPAQGEDADIAARSTEACRSVGVLTFAAVLWHRHLRPWWQVALRQDSSPMDVLGGCFRTLPAARGKSVYCAETHADAPVGDTLLALARAGWAT